MVADNNKQPASNSAETVKANDSVTVEHKLNLPQNSRKRLLFVFVLAVAAISWAFFGLHIGQKVYAQAAGHKIYKADIEELIGSNKGISKHEAATVLADKYLTESMAKDQGITVTSKDIETTYGPSINQAKAKYKYSYQLQVNSLYFDKLQAYNQGVYKGFLLVTQFSRGINLQSGKTDPAVVADDKKYAQDFITDLYSQIQAKKITWEQAAQTERNNTRVGLNMYPTLSHSGPFDTAKAPAGLLTPPSAHEQIRKIKPGQTSKPFMVSVSNSVGTNSNETFGTYFLVVRMDKASGGNSNINFQQEMLQAKQRLGYKVYV